MNPPFFFSIALALFVLVILYGSIKIAQEDERFAVFVLGRFTGYKGPGLIIQPFAIAKSHRLRVGDIGALASPEFAKFGDVDVPVANTNSLKTGDQVRIDGFDASGPRLAASSERSMQHCPKCGHRF